MDNIAVNITDLWTIQYLSKTVGKISTSGNPANLDLATSHCFTNGMVADRQMLLLDTRLMHGDTLEHQLIVYIHVSGSFDSHAKHPNSQLVATVIRIDKTCDLDQQAHRIWHVRRQLILIIWLMLLPVLALVEFSTFVWHAWIKNNFGSVIMLYIGKQF